jgi:glycosyltransferase involved in cell wall biosynthesis
MSPLFSIIIPTYNRAKLLEVAIKSVIEQTCDDWELIIVDDGSTDETKAFLDSIKEEKIYTYFQLKKERSAARNFGIEKAKGIYICFLDDDDYFLPNHLAAFEKLITKENFPIGIFRTGMITKDGKQETPSPFFDSNISSHPIPFFLKNMVGIHTLCYHREILDSHRYDERWLNFEDTHLLVLCLLKFPFFQINQLTAIYVRHEGMGSLSIFKSENAKARTENNIAAIRDLFEQGGEELLKYVPSNFLSFMVASKYLHHAYGALQVNEKKLAKDYFIQSLKESKGRFLGFNYLKFSLRFLFSK